MKQLTMMIGYENLATEPAGDPPTFKVRAQSDQVALLFGDADALPPWVTYETTVIATGTTTLQESGTMILGNTDDRLDVTTLAEGFFLPSAMETIMHGTVMWRIERGHGRFSGSSGVVTGNFSHDMRTAAGREFQILNLILPD